MQLVAYIQEAGDAAIKGNILPGGSGGSNSSGGNNFHWLVYAWPTYLIVAAMVLSFWLGERREYLVLTRTSRLPHRRLRHT